MAVQTKKPGGFIVAREGHPTIDGVGETLEAAKHDARLHIRPDVAHVFLPASEALYAAATRDRRVDWSWSDEWGMAVMLDANDTPEDMQPARPVLLN